MKAWGEKPAAVGAADRQNMINSNPHAVPSVEPQCKIRHNLLRLRPENRRAFQRRKELAKLVDHVRCHGLTPASDQAWATVLANLAPFMTASRWEDQIRHRDRSKDDCTFRRMVRRILDLCLHVGVTLDLDEVNAAAESVAAAIDDGGKPIRLLSHKRCGALLGVTAADREAIGARTIDAVDENAADRKRRLARERAARKRAKKGAKPRNNSLSQIKPWVAAGVSRRTWYRNQKEHNMTDNAHRGTNSSPLPNITKGSVTNPCQIETYIAIQTAEYKRAESIVAMATRHHQDYIDQCMSAVRRLPPDFWRKHAKPEAIAAGLIEL